MIFLDGGHLLLFIRDRLHVIHHLARIDNLDVEDDDGQLRSTKRNREWAFREDFSLSSHLRILLIYVLGIACLPIPSHDIAFWLG